MKVALQCLLNKQAKNKAIQSFEFHCHRWLR